MSFKIVEHYISEKDLKEMQDIFALVCFDECKPCRKWPEGRPEVAEAAHEVLKALEIYRKAINGDWV